MADQVMIVVTWESGADAGERRAGGPGQVGAVATVATVTVLVTVQVKVAVPE